MFVYFFELMGVHQVSDLKILAEKSMTIKREQDWDKFFKEHSPEAMVNFERLQLLSMEKEGLNHKKQFKRFCKIVVGSLVDMYPLRDQLLAKLVDKVCLLAQSKIRLVRFGFTYVALGLLKVLLSQFNDLNSVFQRLKAQPSLSREKDAMLSNCHGMLLKLLELVSIEVV